MSTDTHTLPRRALEHDRPTPVLPTPVESGAHPAPPVRRRKHGAGLLRLLLQTRHPAADPVLLLGPTGGPVWLFRAQ